jgi:phosphoribosylaminoimidazole-succinocarboxamide synthase
MNAMTEISLDLKGVKRHYKGKVRELYEFESGWLMLLATDRLSAFDVILPKGIPYKGQVLTQLAQHFLKETAQIVPNWSIASPDPNVAIGRYAEPFKVEMVIRGHLSGHAWRTYKSGIRELCGVTMPEGLKENDPFPEALITPTTKADQGDHDEDISREDILTRGVVSEADYIQLENYTRALFAKGQEMARERGLILVDTKYEFGKTNEGEIILIDEVHTPDSSRYFYSDGFEERQKKGEKQEQLSKEFVREWLIEKGFQGKEGQTIPEMTPEVINTISQRYIQLYEKLTGLEFEAAETTEIDIRINRNLELFLKQNPEP